MQFYLAARYSRAEEMREVQSHLEALGHKVTSRWIEQPHGADSDIIRSRQDIAEQAAVEDLEDLTAADVVISFAGNGSSKKEKPSKGGRHVEFGVGLALNKESVVIGTPENAFHWLPNVDRYDTIEDYIETLEQSE